MVKSELLKALVVKNSVLHDFGFGKVSWIHETFLMELQLFGWRHFSKTEVVQNTKAFSIRLKVSLLIFGVLNTAISMLVSIPK